ncbi:unnamed protein product [marine sediment metagenome]|uniref:Glutaredoxin domain-containing protein n=1 Tax=marine sediment metagenome TaxID=412755 RepID=X1LR54_9ZZZZ
MYCDESPKCDKVVKQLKRMKVKFETKDFNTSKYASDSKQFKDVVGETPTPLICVRIGDHEKCTLKVSDLKKLKKLTKNE